MADRAAVQWLVRVYRMLMYAYPRDFRSRYGREMAQVFRDRCRQETKMRGLRSVLPLLSETAADLFVTAVRERTAAALPAPQFTAATGPSADGVPVFYSGAADAPEVSALIHGGLLSLAIFSVLTFVMMHWGNRNLSFLIGTYHPRPGSVHVDRSSATPARVSTEVNVRPDGDDPWLPFARAYFRIMPVLRVLDADQDYVLSATEIANAPQRLWLLDKNRDGKLDPEECGLSFGDGAAIISPQLRNRARSEFMRFHPVLAALDINHDGEISAEEIARSRATLRRLDSNRDGILAADELAPPGVKQ